MPPEQGRRGGRGAWLAGLHERPACCWIICWAMANPIAISVAAPPGLPPFSMPCAIWNLTCR